MKDSENQKLLKQAQAGWFWTGGEQFIQRGLGMLVGLVLARLLGPEAFGLVASVTIFLNVAQQVINGGISQRVIQKKDVSEDDYLALFWSNLVMSLGATAILAAISFPVAAYFAEPQLTSVMIGLAVVLYVTNAGRVQQAKLTRQLAFKKLAVIQIVATVSGCIAGLFMAFNGFGVWALIGQQAVVAGLRWIMYCLVCPWRAKGLPSRHSVQDLYSFGLPVVASQCLRSFADQASSVMIAKNFSMGDLGYFNRGRLIPQNLGFSLQLILSRTTFPALSKVSSDPEMLVRLYKHFLKLSGGIASMIMTGLYMCATDVVTILLGDEWLPSVWYMRVSAIAFTVFVIYGCNLDLMKSVARTKRLFLYNTITAVLQILGVGLGWWIGGIKGIVLGDLAGRGVGCLIFMKAVAQVSSISIWKQLWILMEVVLVCLLLSLVIFLIQQGIPALGIRMPVVTFIGAISLFLYWKWVAKSQGSI